MHTVRHIPMYGTQHTPDEYGTTVDPATGRHSGGPFLLRVRGAMRVEELRLAIRVSVHPGGWTTTYRYWPLRNVSKARLERKVHEYGSTSAGPAREEV